MKIEESIWFDICYNNYDQVREQLKSYEIDPNYIQGDKSLLHLIAKTMEVDIAKSLLDMGADVDLKDAYGNTPVLEALFQYDKNDFKDDSMVKLLFEYGASKDSVNNYGVGVQKELDIVREYSGKTLTWLDNVSNEEG